MKMASTLPPEGSVDKPTCSAEEGCSKPVHCKNLCQMHYRRLRLHGSTAKPQRRKKPGPKPDPTKPFSKHRPQKPRVYEPKTHCPHGHPYDEGNTHIDARGYKHCRTCQRARMAERRPTTVGQGGHNKAKTHCPKGHPYDEVNTIYSKDRRRWCRTCSRTNSAKQNIKRYGITVEQFRDLIERQMHCCAICQQPFGDAAPHVDHDHSCCPAQKSCGKCIRGLLCGYCNRGIGLFRDTPTFLRVAARYLERYAS